MQVQIAEIDPRGKLSLVPVDNTEAGQGSGSGDSEGAEASSVSSSGDDS